MVKRPIRRRRVGKDPIESLISYLGDRLRSGQPIRLPFGSTGLDDFARNEGAFLLRHQANTMAGQGQTPQERAFSLGKSKALAALADFLESFGVRVEEGEPDENAETQQRGGVKITQNSVDGRTKPPDNQGRGGPTFDV